MCSRFESDTPLKILLRVQINMIRPKRLSHFITLKTSKHYTEHNKRKTLMKEF